MSSNELSEYFSRVFPFFNAIPKEEQEFLLNAAHPRICELSEIIHSGDHYCTGPLLLRRGRIRAYMLSEEGREITLYRLGEGDFCPMSAPCLMPGDLSFEVTLEAECRSELLLFDSSAFASLCLRNPTVECYMLRAAMLRFSEVMQAFRGILFKSLDRRLASCLIGEIDRRGGDTVHLTQEEIARYTGSAREAISRRLKALAAEGRIAVLRGAVKIIDPDGLRALADGLK